MRDEPVVVEEEEPRSSSLKFAYPVLAVIVLALLWFTFREPLRLVVLPFESKGGWTQLQRTASFTRLQAIDSAVILYYRINSSLPQQLDDLVRGNYITEQQLVDSWRRPFEYDVRENTYTITGHTPDGKPDGGLSIRRMLQPEGPPQKP